MISKATSKFINSLQLKKYRYEHKKFCIEGKKNIEELLQSDFKIEKLYLTEEAFSSVVISDDRKDCVEITTQNQIEKCSSYKSNNFGIAIVHIPSGDIGPSEGDGFIVALDFIQDPGNLGTIIRACDWYGVKSIICSKNTVDCYSSKVVSSTMGAIFRVQIQYLDLEEYFEKSELPVYGAVLGGNNLHEQSSIDKGILLMGNESNGVSSELRNYCTEQFEIPRFGQTESLNVAMATTIFLDNFSRIKNS